MGKILIGGIVGGIILFFWGFVSHMLLPIGEMGLQFIPQEDGMAAAMKGRRRAGIVLPARLRPKQTSIATGYAGPYG